MAEDSFILLNLKEKESKQIAQVISNETSRKILDYLATKDDATESTIAKELKIPLSTVHYNLQHLKKARLIEVEEFHYSEKGKVVDHYKLANKLVIIAPASSQFSNIREKLGKILPVALVSVVGAFLVYVFGRMSVAKDVALGSNVMMQEAAMDVAPQAVARGVDAVAEQSTLMATPLSPVVTQFAADPLTIALWFLFGAIFSALFISLFAWIRQRYNK